MEHALKSIGYESKLQMLRNKQHRNEADVNAEILEPVLKDILGFADTQISRQNYLDNKQPDYTCHNDAGELLLIAEGKDLDVDLNKRPSPSDPATRIPKVQLEEYLTKRSDSRHGVFGLLSNGEDWRVCRRIDQDVEWFPQTKVKNESELYSGLQPILSPKQIQRLEYQPMSVGKQLLGKIQEHTSPKKLLESIVPDGALIEESHDKMSWYEILGDPPPGKLFSQNYLATITSKGEDGIISIADIWDALKNTVLTADGSKVGGIATAVIEENELIRCATCRIFVWEDGHLSSSSEFDPSLPGTRVLRQLEDLEDWKSGKPLRLIDSLNAKSVHSDFYDEIADWFRRTGSSLNDLRHLIRILFAWFLKEHNFVPEEIFEKHSKIDIHSQLVQLFTGTFCVPCEERIIPSTLSFLRDAFLATPFINGSLFHDSIESLRTPLSDEAYDCVEGDSGLFTILKRYEWTLTEHDELHSDTSLDPSMIGSVFERFVAISSGVKPSGDAKQPNATYYTPLDVTNELVADAIAFYLSNRLSTISYNDALELIHPRPQQYFNLCSAPLNVRLEVKNCLRDMTILDPCTGSGEFIVASLNALRRAERRLFPNEYDEEERTSLALKKQLFASDIHPIAVQITRLRFYLALVKTGLGSCSVHSLKPFPNLETRITAVNSLATRMHVKEYIFSFLESSDLEEWRQVRDEYMFAYTESEKKEIRNREQEVRNFLRQKVEFPTPDLEEWFENDILEQDDHVSAVGLQLVFGRTSWDVVIGNPPYESIDKRQKLFAEALGYQTSSCGNQYTLFVELGARLATQRHGIVTMIVPHSIAFDHRKQPLRRLCEDRFSRVHVRTYNNRPQAVFPPHPFIKGGIQRSESRQRICMITLLSGQSAHNEKAQVMASSYISIPQELRKQALAARPSLLQPEDSQWTTAGSPALHKLLTAVRDTHCAQLSFGVSQKSREISYPETAYHFITCLPNGFLVHRKKSISVPDDEYFWARICFYNSRLFHTYWMLVGDAFHLTKKLFKTAKLPPKWLTDDSLRKQANQIGKEFCTKQNLEKSRSSHWHKGREFPNYNFVEHLPHVVARADDVCIKGFDLSSIQSELNDEMKQVGVGRTWMMG